MYFHHILYNSTILCLLCEVFVMCVEIAMRRRGIFFFAQALLLSIHTPLFLLSSCVSLSYFNLALPMRQCLGRHSCMSSQFFIAILYYTLVFSRNEMIEMGLSKSKNNNNNNNIKNYQLQITKNIIQNFMLHIMPICMHSMKYTAGLQ